MIKLTALAKAIPSIIAEVILRIIAENSCPTPKVAEILHFFTNREDAPTLGFLAAVGIAPAVLTPALDVVSMDEDAGVAVAAMVLLPRDVAPTEDPRDATLARGAGVTPLKSDFGHAVNTCICRSS